MALEGFAEFKRVGTFTERVKTEASRAERAKDERARRDFAIARLGYAFREGGHSCAQTAELLRQVMTTAPDVLPPGPIPGRQQVWVLAERFKNGERSVDDYREKGTRGRRRQPVDPKVQAFVTLLLSLASPKDKHKKLWAEVDKYARDRGLPTIGYDKFLSLVKAHGRDRRNAAYFGVRAGELLGTHGTLAVRYTHDCHTFDGFELPRYYKAWDRDLEQFMSVIPTALIQQDYRSGAVVGLWVADPTRRRNDAGAICRSGIDYADVVALILSATVPALASPATREFSGRMPLTVRFDRHQAHETLRAELQAAAIALQLRADPFFADDDPPTVVEIPAADGAGEPTVSLANTPRLPARRPKNRGKVERRIQMIEEYWPDDLVGNVDKYRPLDRWTEDDSDARRTAAAVGEFQPRRLPVAVEDLPDISQAPADLDAVVAYWNVKRTSRLTGDTARARYHRYLPRSPRKGIDALALLETRTGFVEEKGIVVYHDSRETVFSPDVPGSAFALKLDATVTYKLDPLHRGLFVRVGDEVHLLQRMEDWSAEPGRAEQVAREQYANAFRWASDAAKTRGREYDQRLGPGALADAMQAAKEREQRANAGTANVRGRADSDGPDDRRGGDGADIDPPMHLSGDRNGRSSLAGTDTGGDRTAPGRPGAARPTRARPRSDRQAGASRAAAAVDGAAADGAAADGVAYSQVFAAVLGDADALSPCVAPDDVTERSAGAAAAGRPETGAASAPVSHDAAVTQLLATRDRLSASTSALTGQGVHPTGVTGEMAAGGTESGTEDGPAPAGADREGRGSTTTRPDFGATSTARVGTRSDATASGADSRALVRVGVPPARGASEAPRVRAGRTQRPGGAAGARRGALGIVVRTLPAAPVVSAPAERTTGTCAGPATTHATTGGVGNRAGDGSVGADGNGRSGEGPAGD